MIGPRKVVVESCIKNQKNLDMHPNFYTKFKDDAALEAKLQEVLNKLIEYYNGYEKDLELYGQRASIDLSKTMASLAEQIDIMSASGETEHFKAVGP